MELRKSFPRIMALLLFFSVFLLPVCAPSSWAGAEDPYWNRVLSHLQEIFESASNGLTEAQLKVDADQKEFARDLSRLEKVKGQMVLWFGSNYNPNSLGFLYDGICGLQHDAEDMHKPFAEARRKLDYSAAKLKDIEEEIASQINDATESEYVPALQKDLEGLTTLRGRLDGIRNSLDRVDETYNGFAAKLEDVHKIIRERTRTYWKIYYLEIQPELFSTDAWINLKESVDEWLSYAESWSEALMSTYDPEEFRSSLMTCFFMAGGLILVGILVGMKIRSSVPVLAEGMPSPRNTGLLSAWCLFSLAVTLSWAGDDFSFALYPFIDFLTEVFTSSCMIVLAIALHRDTEGSTPPLAASLWLFWGLMMLGMTLQTFQPPYVFAQILWIAGLGGFAWLLGKIFPETGKGRRFLVGLAAWASFGLAAGAIFGLLALSILTILVFFYVLAGVLIGLELLRWLRRWETRARKRGESILTIALLSGLGYPVVILGLLHLNLWFMASRLGGPSFFLTLLSTGAGWGTVNMDIRSASYAIVGFFFTRSAVFVLESFIQEVSQTWQELDTTVKDALLVAMRYTLWGLFALWGLSLSGLNLDNLAVVAGGLSVGIGFGLQHIVSNLFGGLILILGRSIHTGDTIQLGDMKGDVQRVTIRNTVVQTRDNATLFIPNSELITSKLLNWSHRDKRVVREVDIGVAYGSQTDIVRKLLLEACTQCASVLTYPQPQVLFWDFASSSLEFKLRFWIEDVRDELEALSEMRFRIDKLFRESGIEIAFPQADVHVRTAPGLERLLTGENLKLW